MDAGVCAKPGCGNPLFPGRRLKSFCSYACRGQFKVLEAIGHRTGLKGSKNTKQNKVLQTLKRQSVAGFSFAKVNSCTYRLDRPNKLSAGWLMEASPCEARQRWVARVGNRASGPLTLSEAKRAAIAMLRERKETEFRDWIAELNMIAAGEVHCAWKMQQRKQWPRDLVGGGSRPSLMQMDGKLRDAILNAELLTMPPHADPLSGDGFRLEFDERGYPELPELLRRRARYAP